MIKRVLDQQRRELMADAIAAERRGDVGRRGQHGTEGGYHYGCRCDECRSASSDARKRRRQANLEGQRQKDREYKKRRRKAQAA